MKIDRIEIHPLVGRLEEPFGWSQRWTHERLQIVVRIRADSGAYGWGETGGTAASIPAFQDAASGLIGEDPSRIGAIWQSMIQSAYQGGGYSGLVSNILSAFDMALYDLNGRDRGLPVCELLGGKLRDRVAVYATGLYYTPDDLTDKSWARFLDEGQGYVDQGFTGMKMKIGGLSVDEDVDRVHALRRHVGDDVRIMVDANEAYDPMTALQVARRLADADVTWFEEPCGSRDLDDNALVTRRSPIPTSGGESMATRRDAGRLLKNRVFDIIQPEICNVGGISELRVVATMADAFNTRFVPHFWGPGISIAAIMHTLATIPQIPPAHPREPYVNEPVSEFDQTPHPIRASITDPILRQQNSFVEVPTSPGLGFEIDEDAIASLRDGEACILE